MLKPAIYSKIPITLPVTYSVLYALNDFRSLSFLFTRRTPYIPVLYTINKADNKSGEDIYYWFIN